MTFLNSFRVLLAYAFVAAWFSGFGGTAQAAGCPPVSVTVASGGTVVADLSNCTISGINGYQSPPMHGVNDSRNNNGTGLVYYTNNGDGSATDSFSVIDADDNSVIPFSVTVLASPPSVTTTSLPSSTVGVAYSQSLAASGGTAPYSWALTGGALPAGLSLSSGGSLSGTPTQAGSFNPVFTVTDSANRTSSRTIALNVAAPTIFVAPPTLPNATAGQAYSSNLSASGGTAPYSFAVIAGSLPSGLTLSSSGVLSGTSTMAGSFTFSVRATDSSTGSGAPFFGQRTYTLTVGAPTVLVGPTTLSNPTVGQAYSQNVVASGGTAPYTFAITAGALPAGLTLSSAGALSGTPVSVGTFNFTTTATDSGGFTGNRAYTVTVAAPALTVAPASLSSAVSGQAYSQALTASGGTAPYSFSVTAGSLPSGVALSAAGVLSGTPTVAGSFNLTVTATDSSTGSGAPFSGSRAYTLTVGAPAVVVAPAALPAATAGQAYSAAVTASGGTAPYSFAVTAGALPTGLTLNQDGTLSGTSTVQGSFTFTATATDGNGFTGNRTYTLTVAAPTVVVAPAILPNPTVGQAYSQTLAASGGTAPYTYAITAGAVPAGLTLSSAGTLSGTATTAGTFNFTVTTTDANGFDGSRAYTLNAVLAPPVASSVSLSVAANSSANIVPLALSGGTATSVQVATQGSNGTATASGTSITYTPNPGFAGPDSFTYTATNASGTSAPGTVSITVAPATNANLASLVPNLGTLSPAFAPGTNSYALAVPNSQGSISLTPTVADVAATVSVNGSAVTSGSASAPVPLAVGTTSIPVVVTAQNGSTNTYTVVVTRAASAVATLVNLTPSAGTLNPSFASGTTTYTLALPAGLTSLSFTPTSTDATATVTVNGTPVASGAASGAIAIPVGTTTVPVVVTAADGTTTRSYVVTVTRAAPAIALQPGAGPLPEATAGSSYSLTLAPSGGTAPYTFAVTAGALPAGLVLDPGKGTIAGTPTAAGEASFTVTVTDASGASGTLAYRLVVKATPVVAVSQSETIEAGTTTTVDLTAGASGGPFTDARLVSLSPPDAGTAVIILAETAAADDQSFAEAVRKRRYTLKFTPSPTSTGRAVATFTLSNATGTSAPATITFLVAPRADPSKDADVIGLLTAQVDASRRFAKDQTRNFNNRLEQLHDEGERRHSSMDVRLGYNPDEEPEGLGQQRIEALRHLDEDQAKRMNEALPGLLSGYGPEDGKGPRPRSRLDSVAGDPRDPQSRDRGLGDPATPELNLGRFAVWSGGYVNFGDRDAAGLDLDYTTVGVSGGVDYRFSPSLVAGFGVGYGRDATDVGDRGTESRGHSYSAAVYGSWKPMDGLYLDGLVGGSRLDFDSLRFVTGDGSTATGERDGRQMFGSLTASYEQRRDNWLLSPYGRFEVARSWLDGFSESGPSALNLTYGEQSVDTVAGVLGVRGFYAFDMDWGVLKPGFRAEYTHDFAGDSEVALGYTDIGTSPYSVRTDATQQDYATLGLSLDANFSTRWTAGLDYRTSFGRETQNHAFGLKVGTRF